MHAAREFQRTLFDAGFAGISTPRAYGGQGLSSEHAHAFRVLLSSYDAPSLRPLGIGLGLAVPTILGAASDEQKRRFVPKLLSGEEVWCQLFSEPDAGSDLVSLRARAIRDGDHWIVSGQKVWSSLASDAAYGMLLARTDLESDRPHNAITMFILPMHLRGVVVRSLIDIAGGRHFNEVFLEDVALSDSDVMGEVNRGWMVATDTLSGERGGYTGGSGRGRRLRQALHAWTLGDRVGPIGPLERQHIAQVYSDERVLEWLVARIESGSVLGGNVTVGSLVKVSAGNLEQSAAELVVDLGGPSAQAWDRTDPSGDIPYHNISASRQSTIAGGTHQIQRNLIGERLLGLAREPRP